jgi:hypothetical protein
MVDMLGKIDVYLPGRNKDFTRHDGVAIVKDNGEIHITLREPSAAKRLVDLKNNRVLVDLAFSYKEKYPITSEDPESGLGEN